MKNPQLTRARNMALVYSYLRDNPNARKTRVLGATMPGQYATLQATLDSLRVRGLVAAVPSPDAWGAFWSISGVPVEGDVFQAMLSAVQS